MRGSPPRKRRLGFALPVASDTYHAMARVMLCAAEASGDRMAAALVEELRRRRPEIGFFGLVGPAMRQAGVHPIADAAEAAGFGFVEVVGRLPKIAGVLRMLTRSLGERRPDLLITVDSPGLLLRLGRNAKLMGIPVIHWVCPQIWAWRPGRADQLHRSMDTLMCLFEMELPYLLNKGVRGVFTGHPALDLTSTNKPAVGVPVIGLAPGSRPQEVDRLWPVMRSVADILRRRMRCEFVVLVAPTIDKASLDGLDAHFVDSVSEAGNRVIACLAASGTVTLELAALGVPTVVVYRVNPLTHFLARRLVRRVNRIALPNILSKKDIVPEFIQHFEPAAIASSVEGLLGKEGELQRSAFRSLMDSLGGKGAVGRAADVVEAQLFG